MRRKNRARFTRRAAAGLMAGVTLSMSMAVPARAAAPAVEVDETMYVNLDYYGTPTQINVVKGCMSNGAASYTDYGVYDKLVNMTDKTEPQVGEGCVTWQLPEENKRFYYQGTMPEGSMELPWSFDVSYKLNGVSADAASLAGASGLVELNVKAVPNPKARAYYRNNMILSVVIPVDMEKAYSVEAPGSQLQSLGNNTAVMFAALPGEEGDYTVRIGTDSFESVGVIMMMVPGTMDALNHIKDIKEAKDTWREEGDRMYDSMNQLLRSMEAMKGDVAGASKGVAELEEARASVSANRKQIEALSTQAVSDLASITEQTARLIPYLDTAQSAVTDINANFDAIYNTMEDTQDELDRLYDRLGGLKNSLNSLAGQIEGGVSFDGWKQQMEEIEKETEDLKDLLGSLDGHIADGTGLSETAKSRIGGLKENLSEADAFRYDRRRAQREIKAEEAPEEAEQGKTAQAGQDSPEGRDGAGDAEGAEETKEEDITAFGQTVTALPMPGQEALLSPGEAESASGAESEKGAADGMAGTDPAAAGTEAEDLRGPSGLPGSGGYNEEDFEAWSEELDPYADEVEETLSALLGTGYTAQAEEQLSAIDTILGSAGSFQQSAAAVIGKINAVCASAGNASERAGATVSALRGVTDELINLLDDGRVLIDTADGYVPSLLDGLGDTQELLRRLTKAMGSAHGLLSMVNTTVIGAGDSLDAGARDSLKSMKGVLDKSIGVLDDITQVREASESMKQTLDEELDKFEEENLFLNLDPEADMVSFTSSENRSPRSLQIILRTDEISDEDHTTDISDAEELDSEDLGPFERMWRVLVRIVEAVIAIFRDR